MDDATGATTSPNNPKTQTDVADSHLLPSKEDAAKAKASISSLTVHENAGSSIISEISEVTAASSDRTNAQGRGEDAHSTSIAKDVVTSKEEDVNATQSHHDQQDREANDKHSRTSYSSSPSSAGSDGEIIEFTGKRVPRATTELGRTFQSNLAFRQRENLTTPQPVSSSFAQFVPDLPVAYTTAPETSSSRGQRPEHETARNTESGGVSMQTSFENAAVTVDLLIDHPALDPPTNQVSTLGLGWDPNRGVAPWVSRSKPGIGWSLPRRKKVTARSEFILTEEEQEEAIKEFWESGMASIDQQPAFGDETSQMRAITFAQPSDGMDPVQQDDASTPSSDLLLDTVPTTTTLDAIPADTASGDLPPTSNSSLAVHAGTSPIEDGEGYDEVDDSDDTEQDEIDELLSLETTFHPPGENDQEIGKEAKEGEKDEENDQGVGEEAERGEKDEENDQGIGEEVEEGDNDGENEGSDESSDSPNAHAYRHQLQEELDARYARILAERERRRTGMTQHQAFGLDGTLDDLSNTSSSTIKDDDERSDASGDSDADEDRAIQKAMDYYAAMPKPSRSGKAAALENAMDPINVDDYDDANFDIMDWNRPSLHKNRKSKTKAEVESDSDSVDRALKELVRADGNSKKRRRENRNALRKQGLLGAKSRASDSGKQAHAAWARTTFATFNATLRSFLETPQRRAYFPASDGARSAVLVEVARHFQLELRTEGSGARPARFVLRKHQRRPFDFDEDSFNRAMDHVETLWPPPEELSGCEGAARADANGEKRRRRPRYRYREGEVIGAGAKEVGSDNRGHQMMLKMGWQPGMAIGKENNKGILVPIETIFKSNKAGVGGSGELSA